MNWHLALGEGRPPALGLVATQNVESKRKRGRGTAEQRRAPHSRFVCALRLSSLSAVGLVGVYTFGPMSKIKLENYIHLKGFFGPRLGPWP